MKERELLARVAFETVHNNGISEKLYGEIEAYLAEPAQEPEPVAYINGTYGGRICIKLINQSLVLPDGMALYATPLNGYSDFSVFT